MDQFLKKYVILFSLNSFSVLISLFLLISYNNTQMVVVNCVFPSFTLLHTNNHDQFLVAFGHGVAIATVTSALFCLAVK